MQFVNVQAEVVKVDALLIVNRGYFTDEIQLLAVS